MGYVRDWMRALPLLAHLAMVGCAHASRSPKGSHTYPELQQATLQFAVGVTATKIEAMLGKPEGAEASLCGAGVGAPWKCTKWTYRPSDADSAPRQRLVVMFQGQPLTVNSWDWY